jgi:uncharacterized membrane-anchored protein
MSLLQKSLLVGLIQVLVVGALGAKFTIDRATYPRVWVQTQPFDPDLPIRGRYVRIRAVVDYEDSGKVQHDPRVHVFSGAHLEVRGDKLVAVADEHGPHPIANGQCADPPCFVLSEPLAYFIPEHVADPSVRPRDEELWVEVTVPPTGAPRPIRLGVKANGVIRPLELR